MARTLKLMGLSIAIGAALCTFQIAQASASEYNSHAKSGQAALVGHLYSCSSHVPGGDGGYRVEHGTVTLKDATYNACGNPNEPAREVWYTSTPGFKGVDRVTFPMGKRGNGGITYVVTVQ
jgi:hypothetical protein